MKNSFIIILVFVSHSFFTQNNVILIPYKKDSLWGFCDTLGRIKIEPVYEKVEFFKKESSKVKKNGKFGFININGEIIIPPIYDKITKSDSLYLAEKNNFFGIINEKNEIKLPFEFEKVEGKREQNTNYIIVKKDAKYGVYIYQKNTFVQIIPTEYKSIDKNYEIDFALKCMTFSNEIINIGLDGKIIPKKEKELKKTKESEIIYSIEEVVPIQDYKVTNQEKEETKRIPKPEELNLTKFSVPKYYLFTKNSKYGLIKISPNYEKGKGLLPIYDTIQAIYDKIDTNYRLYDLFIVKNGKFEGLVSSNGKIILDVCYDKIDVKPLIRSLTFKEYYLILNKNGRSGIVQVKKYLDQNRVKYESCIKLPFEYNKIEEGNDYFIVKQNNKYGVFETKSEIFTIPLTYSSLIFSNLSFNNFCLFNTLDNTGEKVFIGYNGIEFFSGVTVLKY